MSKTTGVILTALVITVVTIAIGYANLSGQVITISGQLQAQADVASNFKFAFSGAEADANNPEDLTVTATANGTLANFSVSGLKEIGDTASATYTIKNDSVNLKATQITADVKEGNTKYFETTITEEPATELAVGGAETTITVTTKLIAAPLENLTQNVKVEISAVPVDANV